VFRLWWSWLLSIGPDSPLPCLTQAQLQRTVNPRSEKPKNTLFLDDLTSEQLHSNCDGSRKESGSKWQGKELMKNILEWHRLSRGKALQLTFDLFSRKIDHITQK